MVNEELQASGLVRSYQHRREASTDQPREHADGQEEAWSAAIVSMVSSLALSRMPWSVDPVSHLLYPGTNLGPPSSCGRVQNFTRPSSYLDGPPEARLRGRSGPA